jgi:sterol desaturase/sphingolipid hydroxylase (fatty acid hydroxylase superfamily)
VTEWLAEHEPSVRLGAFAGVFVLMTLWEVVGARRQLALSKSRRWLSNLSLVVLNTVVLRLVFPTAAVGAALVATERGWGVLNWFELPAVLAVLASVVMLDLAIYLQHVMFHAVPVLWRLHMVHHADVDFDVTTGSRFHTLEILVSMGIKLALVVLLGPPVVGVLLFEVLLNATAMFNHANVRLPGGVDRVLRWLVVTPDMHRVHHSVESTEANSNFGFNLPWWDRLFGTYREQPAAGHEEMEIGVAELRDRSRPQGLLWMLKLPFTRSGGEYPINRRRWS